MLSVKLSEDDKTTHTRLKEHIESKLGINLSNPEHMNRVIADESVLDEFDSFNNNDSGFSCDSSHYLRKAAVVINEDNERRRAIF